MKKIIFILMLLMIPAASALEGHMTLLAAYETGNGTYEGTPADLTLEITKGRGRVFLETFPLTKMDTQISTRFSKDIACSYLDISCSNYDFIYTIKADSIIIGGPSAGAAVSLLTISLLNNLELDQNVAMTGTINSGGIIGPVGGIKAKIDAASKAGMTKVLIPKGERFIIEGDETEDLKEHADKFNITLVEVSDIDEALEQFTGKRFVKENKTIITDESYKETMKFLAERLCNRSDFLIAKINPTDNQTKQLTEIGLNLTQKGRETYSSKKYYSAASYCFGANVKFSHAIMEAETPSFEQRNERITSIRMKIKDFDEKISKKEIKTITDLESFAVVKERLKEAEGYIDEAWLSLNNSEESIFKTAYAEERLYSAYSWAFFFDNRGRVFDINKEQIKESCIKKISEAEERYQYLLMLYPLPLDDTRKEIDFAKHDLENESYELCLFKASKAKASSDILLNLMGVDEDNVEELISQKLSIVKNTIAKQVNNNIFPIVGYSYYEYADTLKEDDPYSALLYSEYALELSNLDMYFNGRKTTKTLNINPSLILIFFVGLLIGVLISFIIIKRK